MVFVGGESVVGVVVIFGKLGDKKKEKKLLILVVLVEFKLDKLLGKLGMDVVLDDLIDILGGFEEIEEENIMYIGLEVLDLMSFIYIEELGKREVIIFLKYRELLVKMEGIIGFFLDFLIFVGLDDVIDVLLFDFICGLFIVVGKKIEKEEFIEVLKV